jgi:hypothetical protein
MMVDRDGLWRRRAASIIPDYPKCPENHARSPFPQRSAGWTLLQTGERLAPGPGRSVNLELREVVWVVVGFLALYAMMQLGRLHGLRRARQAAREAAAPADPASSPDAGGLELEVQQLRRELALLRADLEGAAAAGEEADRRLEAELARLREAVEGVQAERSISPHYGEAMVLARRGLAAEAIAERCGISVAEAALVCALAQKAESQSGEAS